MKKLTGILLVICALLLVGCGSKKEESKEENKDAIKFKEEYESLNGKENASGLAHRELNIDKDNPYVYITPEEVVKKIENKETFFLFVGDKQCPWCRSVVEKSIKVAKDYNVKTIYYVNIWDDDHNEILRDKYELDDNNKPKKINDGTEAYEKLLNYFDELLREYTLTTDKGKEIKVGEKRIFAPNYFYIKDGKAISLVTGKSENQKDSREELTDEILDDEEEQFEKLFSIASSCDESC